MQKTVLIITPAALVYAVLAWMPILAVMAAFHWWMVLRYTAIAVVSCAAVLAAVVVYQRL